MKALALCALVSLLFAGIAVAGKPQSDIPITQHVSDYDDSLAPYTIQSDTRGAYRNGVDGDISVLMASANNGMTWGDRLLETSTIRKLAITFSQENAVQPGDPGYLVPPNPPVWGTLYTGVRFMNKCSADSLSMYAMKAGDRIICQMHIRLHPLDSTTSYYRLDMGTPGEDETQKVQITCNAADSTACADWFIDPIPVVNADGTISPGKTRARLNYFPAQTKGKPAPYNPNQGAFYMTFHIHVTRP